MSSSPRSTITSSEFDMENAFSTMNIHNYTSASSATSGSTSFNSSEDSRDGMIPPTFSLFYNNPYLKNVQAFYAKESPIPPPDPITLQVILTPSPILPPSLLIAVTMEYFVNISKRRAFWSLNEDILKITVLTTNTPYPSRKIGMQDLYGKAIKQDWRKRSIKKMQKNLGHDSGGQPGLDELDFDDLYNKIKGVEHVLKGVQINYQNMLFFHRCQGQMKSFVPSLLKSFYAQNMMMQDLLQIDEDAMERIDIRWQVAMITHG
ncbi:hypothetical protein Tco_0127359 [Tanacetum coccineum]